MNGNVPGKIREKKMKQERDSGKLAERIPSQTQGLSFATRVECLLYSQTHLHSKKVVVRNCDA